MHSKKMRRGGSWLAARDAARYSTRNWGSPNSSYDYAGMRCCTGNMWGSSRVIRGGCWFLVGRNVRSAGRHAYGPGSLRAHNLGFRLATTGDKL